MRFAHEGPSSEEILPANPLTEMSDESLDAFVDSTLVEDAIPELIEASAATVRIEATQRIATEAAPQRTPVERALAAFAVRRDAPLARAHARAEEHASSAFGPMLARAVERIRPVADHTVPIRMPSRQRTIVGIAPDRR